MSQNREKEETLDLKLTSSLCPENCKLSAPTNTSTNTNTNITSNSQICASPDPARPDPIPGLSLPPPETPAEAPDPEPAAVSRKAVNRCLCCAKRVGLTGFRCRCGELFCSVHRYSDRHDCSFDYKAAGREAIARENPVVRAAKILKV